MIDPKDKGRQSSPKNTSLSPVQREAVEHGEGPLLIGAGAGSGKTRTLTQRVIHLIRQGIPPERIIAITFTNKAADEIKRRIYAELPKDKVGQLPFLGTFHSFGARILREEARMLGRTARFTIFDNNDSLRIIKKVLTRLNMNALRHTASKTEHMISRTKSELINLDELNEEDRAIFTAYEAELKANNAFDFDDLIEKPVRLFQTNPKILERHRERYSYILVDEFQDVNRTEYILVKFLAANHRNLNVVGDDQQSIYRFRGADFRNFLDFEKDWPETKVVNLGENYRSSGAIVRASYGVIKNNKFQRPKKLWTSNEEGALIRIIATDDAEDEAERVVAEISSSHPASREIAVLYRTNAQSRALEGALSLAGIPYEIFGGLKFYDRKEVKDIVSAVRYAMNPKDFVSLERLQKTFRKSVAKELEDKLPRMGDELELLELIGYFMKITDYPTYLNNKFDNVEDRLENVKELLNFAGTFSDASEFLERVTLLQDADRPAKNISGRGVKLMTMHMAKGLEFDKVFIVGATEGIIPHQRSLSTPEEIEEERRLMYVAMTRARQELVISFYGMASRFLYEIPPELVEFDGPEQWTGNGDVYI
jgi:DNA helicase-2/ATP-dependent DNA helicase PcrA